MNPKHKTSLAKEEGTKRAKPSTTTPCHMSVLAPPQFSAFSNKQSLFYGKFRTPCDTRSHLVYYSTCSCFCACAAPYSGPRSTILSTTPDPGLLFGHGPLFGHYLRKYGVHICAVQSLAYDAFQGQACSVCTVYLGTSIYACSRSVPCALRSKVYDSTMHNLKGRFILHFLRCDSAIRRIWDIANTSQDITNLRKTHFAKVEIFKLFRKVTRCDATQNRITMENTICHPRCCIVAL